MNRVKQTTATVNISDLTLASTPTGYVSFASTHAINERFYYCVEGGSQWEIGKGYIDNTGVLVREQVIQSSNSNNKVNFSSGTKYVFETFVGSILTLTSLLHQVAIDEDSLNLGRALHYIQLGEGSTVSQTVTTLNKGMRGDLSLLLPDNQSETVELLLTDNIRSSNGRAVALANGLIVIVDKNNNYQILNNINEVPIEYPDNEATKYLLVPSWQDFDVRWFRNGYDFPSGNYTIEYIGGAVNTKNGNLDSWTVGIEEELYHKIVYNDGLAEMTLLVNTPTNTPLVTKLDLLASVHTKTITHTGGKIGINLFQEQDYDGIEVHNDTILGSPPPTYVLYETLA